MDNKELSQENEVRTDDTTTEYKIDFRGQAGEYFRIWIVNIMLTIVTLGIYSAWAKVRRLRYMYGNTFLAGATFDYHAEPKRILMGRVIMVGLFSLYSVSGKISPVLGYIGLAIIVIATPWLVVRGMIFGLSNTSYRNIRFGFEKDYKGSYTTYWISIFIVVITLGLGFPYWLYRHTKFRLNSSRFGNTKFNFQSDLRSFFKIGYFAIFLVVVGGLALLGSAFLAKLLFAQIIVIGILLLYLSIFISSAYTKAMITNLNSRKTNLGRIRFEANIKPSLLAWIYFSNLLAVIATLGLATPWATIRSTKYRLNQITLISPDQDLDQFIGMEAQQSSAAAEAAVDFWDIDLGL